MEGKGLKPVFLRVFLLFSCMFAVSLTAQDLTDSGILETVSPVQEESSIPAKESFSDLPDPGLEPQAGTAELVQTPQERTQVSLMVLNLYPEALDIQIGEPARMTLKALAPQEPSQFYSFDVSDDAYLFFKESQALDWKMYVDPEGLPKALRFEPGSKEILLIKPDGSLGFIPITLDGDGTDRPVVSLVNASNESLDTIKLTKIGLGDIYKTPSIDPSRLSRFSEIDRGLYMLSAIKEGEEFFLQTPGNDALTALDFLPNTWSLALVVDSSESETLGFKVWNLTD